MQTKTKILECMTVWLAAWNEHNLDGVMALLHDDIVFENWTGETIAGKNRLKKSWAPWFFRHGNFKFITEDLFVDEQEQKVSFSWTLEWPSLETAFKGRQEIRRGVDVLHFLEGKIAKKYTYSKTTLHIDNRGVTLVAK
jgi:ketosteroid isomerase-like protein